jgi:hypothetical protein
MQSEMMRSDRIRSELRTVEVNIGKPAPEEYFTYTPATDATVIDTEGLGATKDPK